MDSRSSGAVVLDLLCEKCLACAGDRVGPDVDAVRVGMRALRLQGFQYLLHAVEVHRRGSRLRYAAKGHSSTDSLRGSNSPSVRCTAHDVTGCALPRRAGNQSWEVLPP